MADSQVPISDEERWKHHSFQDEDLIRRNADFIVYLNGSREVHWEDTSDHSAACKEKKVDIGEVQGRITCLEAIPTSHLSAEVVRSFRCILGEAMCAALEMHPKVANTLLRNAEEFILGRNHEQARKWYVTASSVAALVWFLIAGITRWSYLANHADQPDGPLNILAVGIGGASGALFSILLRVGRAPLDPSAGKLLHFIEGFARITVGVIGAVMLLCALRTGLILPQLTNSFGIVLVCVVAGASERLASTIIERVQGSVDHEQSKKEKISTR